MKHQQIWTRFGAVHGSPKYVLFVFIVINVYHAVATKVRAALFSTIEIRTSQAAAQRACDFPPLSNS